MSEARYALSALVMSTFAFTVCFACWVLNAVLVTFLVGSGELSFDGTQVGWLLALPILTGAVSRVPLGILTDTYGGRVVFFLLMLVVSVPLYLLSFASTFTHFVLASLGFGLAGGSFAVGVAYVSAWARKGKQGTALGIFGAGNAGAAMTTIFAPRLLTWLTENGAQPEGWRLLPRAYAAFLIVTAIAFWLFTKEKSTADRSNTQSLAQRLAPLRDAVVWRFGLYYFLVFGGFVALAQWIVPYSVNVYELSVAQAGMIAAAFSLPSGLIRALGGWLSDRFGGKTVMYWVFGSCVLICLVLSVPRMNITSPGTGIAAKEAGVVGQVSPTEVRVGERTYALVPKPRSADEATHLLPRVTRWQEPAVASGDQVVKKGLLARGVTHIVYPADITLFALLVFLFGVATGIGKAGVYKFIPEQFPSNVGAVGGMVGLIGAMGGFVLPPVFGYLLRGTGLWPTCWVVLAVLSLICLIWMHRVANRILRVEAPELVQLLEHRPGIALKQAVVNPEHQVLTTVEDLLKEIPFLSNLSPEKLRDVAQIGLEVEEVPKGAHVFSEGDQGDALYVILEGAVRVHSGSAGDLTTFGAGDYFGELALLDGQPRSASVQATLPCKFFVINRREFLTLLSDSPGMLGDLLVNLSGKIRRHVAARATLQGAV